MINKTRKRIWPVSLMMAIAVVGVLTVFAALAVAPNGASAHEGATDSTHCADLNDFQELAHDNDPLVDHDCATGSADGDGPVTGNGGNGDGDGNGDGNGTATCSCTPRCRWTSGSRRWTTAHG